MELSAVWVPMFLLTLDGGFDFHATFNGAPLTEMELRPSEYVRRQVRVARRANTPARGKRSRPATRQRREGLGSAIPGPASGPGGFFSSR